VPTSVKRTSAPELMNSLPLFSHTSVGPVRVSQGLALPENSVLVAKSPSYFAADVENPQGANLKFSVIPEESAGDKEGVLTPQISPGKIPALSAELTPSERTWEDRQKEKAGETGLPPGPTGPSPVMSPWVGEGTVHSAEVDRKINDPTQRREVGCPASQTRARFYPPRPVRSPGYPPMTRSADGDLHSPGSALNMVAEVVRFLLEPCVVEVPPCH
jgi:hypothetical protein